MDIPPDLEPIKQDIGTVKAVAQWFLAIVGTLIAAIWLLITKQLEHRRKGEIALHEKINKHEELDNARFTTMMKQQSDNHAEILKEIGNLKGSINR